MFKPSRNRLKIYKFEIFLKFYHGKFKNVFLKKLLVIYKYLYKFYKI
jgi:hypothetical protein